MRLWRLKWQLNEKLTVQCYTTEDWGQLTNEKNNQYTHFNQHINNKQMKCPPS